MGTITIHDREYQVDCIIFDKDGTLIEFDPMWGPRTQKWVEAMASALKVGDDFNNQMYDLIGYSLSQNHIRFEGPLAVATMETIITLASGVVSRYGIPWHEARILARDCAESTMSAELAVGEIVPKGDLVQVMQQLRKAKISIAVVTSDDRQMTENTLLYLGINDLVSLLVCGDDPVPHKPAPDAIWTIADKLNIAPGRMMVVGDSLTDMQLASNAGAAYRVGISSIPEEADTLSVHADAVVTSIEEFRLPSYQN